MITTIRAALSVLMLLGFYVFALALVGAMGVATVLLWQNHSGPNVAKLGFATIVVAVALVIALVRVIRAKPTPMPGLPLSESEAPELWRTVRELAEVANTRVPDEILLIPMVNAAVTEDARMLGLVGGRRRLYVGVPLLQALTVAQLRSVLAHELGHYSRNHTRLGEVAYRGREAIVGTVGQLDGNIVGLLLKQYAKVYMLVAAAVSRRQELEAGRPPWRRCASCRWSTPPGASTSDASSTRAGRRATRRPRPASSVGSARCSGPARTSSPRCGPRPRRPSSPGGTRTRPSRCG
jgi:Zn-dependent protease with chaperone function